MSTPTPAEPGPPDERGPVAQLARLFLTQLLAVVAVAAVIATVFAVTGRGSGPGVSATAGSTSSPSSSTVTSPAPTTTPRSSPSKSPTKSPTAPATPTTSSSPPPSSSSPAGADLAKVDVLNQSAPGGSAQHVADQLDRAGWTIGRVADFHGNVSTSTVYWTTSDQRRQARQIARNLGRLRVLQGFSTLNGSRVSVVLVDKL